MKHKPHYLLVTAGKRKLAETTRRVHEFCERTGWHGLVLPHGASSASFPCHDGQTADAVGFRTHVPDSPEPAE